MRIDGEASLMVALCSIFLCSSRGCAKRPATTAAPRRLRRPALRHDAGTRQPPRHRRRVSLRPPRHPLAPARPPRPRAGARRAPRAEGILADAKLKDVFFDFDKYDIRPSDAKILDANAAWLKTKRQPRAHRGALRRARHQRVQPGAGRASRQVHDELPRLPGHPGQPHHDHQLRRGAARLHREDRRLLGKEPPSALPRQAALTLVDTSGEEARPSRRLVVPRVGGSPGWLRRRARRHRDCVAGRHSPAPQRGRGGAANCAACPDGGGGRGRPRGRRAHEEPDPEGQRQIETLNRPTGRAHHVIDRADHAVDDLASRIEALGSAAAGRCPRRAAERDALEELRRRRRRRATPSVPPPRPRRRARRRRDRSSRNVTAGPSTAGPSTTGPSTAGPSPTAPPRRGPRPRHRRSRLGRDRPPTHYSLRTSIRPPTSTSARAATRSRWRAS